MKNKKNPDCKIENQNENASEMNETKAQKENALKNMRDLFGRKSEKQSYSMNSERTIEILSGQYKGEKAQKFIQDRLDAGTDSHVRLKGQRQSFFMTGSEASGQFLTEEIPGITAEERKENLQLPPTNDGEDLYEVHLSAPHIVIESTVAPQEEFAKKGGYESREGMKQIFVPPKFGDMTPVIEVTGQVEGEKPHYTQRSVLEASFATKKNSAIEKNSSEKHFTLGEYSEIKESAALEASAAKKEDGKEETT